MQEATRPTERTASAALADGPGNMGACAIGDPVSPTNQRFMQGPASGCRNPVFAGQKGARGCKADPVPLPCRGANRALCERKLHSYGGYVYFIQAGGCRGPVKIGFSINPEERLETLQAGNPLALALEAVVPGSARDEKRLHAVFADGRMTGEWFRGDTFGLYAFIVGGRHLEAFPEDVYSPISRMVLGALEPWRTVQQARRVVELWTLTFGDDV